MLRINTRHRRDPILERKLQQSGRGKGGANGLAKRRTKKSVPNGSSKPKTKSSTSSLSIGKTKQASTNRVRRSFIQNVKEALQTGQGRARLATMLDGKTSEERTPEERKLINDFLSDPKSQGRIATQLKDAEIHTTVSDHISLPKGVQGAYLGKGRIVVSTAQENAQLTRTVFEEMGEMLGELAEKRGIQIAEGDVGHRILKMFDGKSVSPYTNPKLFTSWSSDVASVVFRNKVFMANARTQDNSIKTDGSPDKVTMSFETSDHVMVIYTPNDGSESRVVALKRSQAEIKPGEVEVKSLDITDQFPDAIDGEFSLFIIDENNENGGFVVSTTSNQVENNFKVTPKDADELSNGYDIETIPVENGLPATSTSIMAKKDNGEIRINFDAFGDGEISGKNDAGEFYGTGDRDYNDVILTIIPNSGGNLEADISDEPDGNDVDSGTVDQDEKVDMPVNSDPQIIGPESEVSANDDVDSESDPDEPEPIPTPPTRKDPNLSVGSEPSVSEIDDNQSLNNPTEVYLDISFRTADELVVEMYDAKQNEWVVIGAKDEGYAEFSLETQKITQYDGKRPDVRVRNLSLGGAIISGNDSLRARVADIGGKTTIAFEDRVVIDENGIVTGDDYRDAIVTFSDYNPKIDGSSQDIAEAIVGEDGVIEFSSLQSALEEAGIQINMDELAGQENFAILIQLLLGNKKLRTRKLAGLFDQNFLRIENGELKMDIRATHPDQRLSLFYNITLLGTGYVPGFGDDVPQGVRTQVRDELIASIKMDNPVFMEIVDNAYGDQDGQPQVNEYMAALDDKVLQLGRFGFVNGIGQRFRFVEGENPYEGTTVEEREIEYVANAEVTFAEGDAQVVEAWDHTKNNWVELARSDGAQHKILEIEFNQKGPYAPNMRVRNLDQGDTVIDSHNEDLVTIERSESGQLTAKFYTNDAEGSDVSISFKGGKRVKQPIVTTRDGVAIPNEPTLRTTFFLGFDDIFSFVELQVKVDGEWKTGMNLEHIMNSDERAQFHIDTPAEDGIPELRIITTAGDIVEIGAGKDKNENYSNYGETASSDPAGYGVKINMSDQGRLSANDLYIDARTTRLDRLDEVHTATVTLDGDPQQISGYEDFQVFLDGEWKTITSLGVIGATTGLPGGTLSDFVPDTVQFDYVPSQGLAPMRFITSAGDTVDFVESNSRIHRYEADQTNTFVRGRSDLPNLFIAGNEILDITLTSVPKSAKPAVKPAENPETDRDPENFISAEYIIKLGDIREQDGDGAISNTTLFEVLKEDLAFSFDEGSTKYSQTSVEHVLGAIAGGTDLKITASDINKLIERNIFILDTEQNKWGIDESNINESDYFVIASGILDNTPSNDAAAEILIDLGIIDDVKTLKRLDNSVGNMDGFLSGDEIRSINHSSDFVSDSDDGLFKLKIPKHQGYVSIVSDDKIALQVLLDNEWVTISTNFEVNTINTKLYTGVQNTDDLKFRVINHTSNVTQEVDADFIDKGDHLSLEIDDYSTYEKGPKSEVPSLDNEIKIVIRKNVFSNFDGSTDSLQSPPSNFSPLNAVKGLLKVAKGGGEVALGLIEEGAGHVAGKDDWVAEGKRTFYKGEDDIEGGTLQAVSTLDSETADRVVNQIKSVESFLEHVINLDQDGIDNLVEDIEKFDEVIETQVLSVARSHGFSEHKEKLERWLAEHPQLRLDGYIDLGELDIFNANIGSLNILDFYQIRGALSIPRLFQDGTKEREIRLRFTDGAIAFAGIGRLPTSFDGGLFGNKDIVIKITEPGDGGDNQVDVTYNSSTGVYLENHTTLLKAGNSVITSLFDIVKKFFQGTQDPEVLAHGHEIPFGVVDFLESSEETAELRNFPEQLQAFFNQQGTKIDTELGISFAFTTSYNLSEMWENDKALVITPFLVEALGAILGATAGMFANGAMTVAGSNFMKNMFDRIFNSSQSSPISFQQILNAFTAVNTGIHAGSILALGFADYIFGNLLRIDNSDYASTGVSVDGFGAFRGVAKSWRHSLPELPNTDIGRDFNGLVAGDIALLRFQFNNSIWSHELNWKNQA